MTAPASLTTRPPNVAFKPDRATVTADPPDWIIKDIGCESFINEGLLSEIYAGDRRKAGRKIRQQRRRLSRVSASFGHGPGAGVPASILRAKVVLR